jgi:hypothetical protein
MLFLFSDITACTTYKKKGETSMINSATDEGLN